jgi:anti-sigma-K factor RskA
MSDTDDIEALAGEYVLGTLDAEERAEVAARRNREPGLDAAIRAWERRLSPLADLATPVAPPGDLYEQIIARISATPQSAGESAAKVIDLTRRLNRWRFGALAASAIAASLMLFVGVRDFSTKPASKNLVAVLQKDAASPAFLVKVDIDNRVMTVQPVAAAHESGKSYELWIINDQLGKPKSLGVIDTPRTVAKPTLAAYTPEVIEGSTYAVTLEPEGGSPTGDPTGPVVFSGKMLPPGSF